MDPRAALLQLESDENDRFRNKSIGKHNLRAKLREQLKGYSHIRGFPLGPEPSRDAKDSGRTESLGDRRDSIRRRTSSVTRQQDQYDVEDNERKYTPRRPRKQPPVLIPRLLWFTVYLSLCYVAYKSLQYFGSETEVSLCQACSSSISCGVLDDEFVVPMDNLAGLPFGTVFPPKSSLQCRLDVCVPAHVADPQSLCKMVSDEALFYRTRRLLQDEDTEEPNTRVLEYFRRRAMREEGLAGALSPGNFPNEPARVSSPTPPSRGQPAESSTLARGDVQVKSVPPTSTQSPPPQGVSPPGFTPQPIAQAPSSGNLADGAYADRSGIKSVRMSDLPEGMLAGGDCVPLRFAPAEGQGYANTTSEYYMRVTEVENYGQCCSICANEPSCTSWTRVAGGDASVRSCYLKSVLALDPSQGATAYNWQPRGMAMYPLHQELRYTGGVPIMFESGTKDRPYPDYVYGCPYPPSADGTCQVPAGCNCGGGMCYPGCTTHNVASSADSSSSTAPSGSG